MKPGVRIVKVVKTYHRAGKFWIIYRYLNGRRFKVWMRGL